MTDYLLLLLLLIRLEKEAADKDIAPSLTPPLANGLALASSFLLPMMLAHSKVTQRHTAW